MVSLLVEVFIAALITDLATGLGAFPFFFVKEIPKAYNGFAWGLASGLMIAASIIDLVIPGLNHAGYQSLAVGGGIGIMFFLGGQSLVGRLDLSFEDVHDADSMTRIVMILGVMTIHSFPEGFAIGLAFISGIEGLGLILALVIAIHNIPEGLAISIPLKAEGVSTWHCVGYAILSSVPQPIAAVAMVLLTDLLQQYLGIGFGFAAGAMLTLVGLEMIPDGLEYGQRTSLSIGIAAGAVLMYLINVWIQFPGL
ncbi:MAG: ZIP family metal transporter [Candidatus Nanohaloarchaeota archaeon QJJ-7]|nr:ZIP family metal transporter [Candidatus Nanohaloarchaeota archaeon QJJ-7]